MNRTNSKPGKRLLALGLAVVLALGTLPQAVFALPQMGTGGEIISFEPLEDSVKNQAVPLGTVIRDLDLPAILTATVEVEASAEQTDSDSASVQDSGEPVQSTTGSAITLGEGDLQDDEADADESKGDGKEPANLPDADTPAGEDGGTPSGSDTDADGTGVSQSTVPVPVTWAAEPDYDGDTAGIYTFTAEIEDFSFADEVQSPQITVTVGEISVITAFEELPEDIRFQRGYTPDLPDTLGATVGGEPVTVPVTWESETDASKSGLHVFVATPGAGYALAEDVKNPVLSFYRTRMVLLRMIGSGNEGDELQITTAAQLAEIAALTNAGILEDQILGPGSTEQVHLKLMNDLYISDQGDKDGWVPIGTSDNQFKGTFNGDGNTLTGLTINRTGSNDDQGLFGYIGEKGAVSGVGLENVDISVNGYGAVGGVAGIVSGTLSNCFVTGSVYSLNRVGGVAGQVNEKGKVENCYSTGSVSGPVNNPVTPMIGGVVGYTYGTVKNCYSTGSVSGKDYVGGMVGYVASTGKVINCAALNASVTATSDAVGRVVGINKGSENLSENIAFSGMTVNGQIVNDDDVKNGTDKTAADIAANGFFQGVFDSEVAGTAWTYAPGSLPGLFGQTVEMPAHLLDSGNPFSGGDGNDADHAYQITTAAQLAKLAQLVNSNAEDTANIGKYAAKHYKLMNDLDLTGIDPSGDKTGWVPIGNNSNKFIGKLDGNGKTITGLTINRNADYQGLFGYIGTGGTVSGLGLVNVSVSGSQFVGGVAGYVESGTVQNCYSTGSVSGSQVVGGVAGWVDSNGTVQSCYSTGSVSGSQVVGGVAGLVNNGTVQNCYSTGSVSGSDSVGGVAGFVHIIGKVINCAALNPSVTGSNAGRVAGSGSDSGTLDNNIAFSGMGGSVAEFIDGGINGTGKSAAQIAESETLFNLFTDTDIWETADGSLPGLFGQTVDMPLHLLSDANPFAGSGTSESDPYKIYTAAQLAKLAQLVNAGSDFAGKFFELQNNLDLTGIDPGGDKTGWVPIGTEANQFYGSFDGGGHTITGLTINRNADYQGLFGVIGTGGTVSGVGLVNVSVRGGNAVGGVAGYVNGGTVQNCYSAGSVSGSGSVGGVAGRISGGTVENCYSAGSVSGGNGSVGGVAGWVDGGTVQNCYSAGSVSGSQFVGGVAGYVDGTVENCYSAGSVSGSYSVGGVAGYIYSGTVQNCAALNPSVTATGGSNVGRVAGGNLGTPGNLTGNRAFSGMTVTAQSSPKTLDKGAGKLDGADMTATDAITPDFWTTAANWNTGGSLPALWNIAVWEIQADKLPLLKNVGGDQSGESGLYLSPKSAENLTVAVNGGPHSYTGNVITPSVTVKFGNTTLSPDTDYTLVFSNNVSVGTATVTVNGKGGYSGTKTANFTIAVTAPGAPTNVTAVAGNGSATVSFDAPVNNGGNAITGYTVTASPGGQTAAGTASPITVTGLTNGTQYTFTVTARNVAGDSLPSAESNEVTPFAPTVSVTGVSVSPTSHSLTVGGTVQLTATVSPGNATNQAVSWGSSAVTVASVSSSGLVTAHAAGTAAITVTTADGGKTDLCTITVTRTDSSGSSTQPTVTVNSAAQPNQPTIGSITGKTAGTTAQAAVTVTDAMIKAALEQAQAQAAAQNRSAYGVGARITLDPPAAGLTLTLERAALNRLVSTGAKCFELTGSPVGMALDAQALSEIQTQGTGDVTITMKPTTAGGIRSAYDITINSVKDGKIVPIASLGNGSATLAIPCTPGKNESGGYLNAVTLDGNEKATRITSSVYEANSGSVVFRTNHFSVYGVGYATPAAKFTDIEKHWAVESIDYAVGRGLFGGTLGTAFSPDTAITRGEFATALGRLAGVDTKAYTKTSFIDEKADSYDLPYIEWATGKGIMQGIGSGQFAPDRAITRQEVAVILQTYAEVTGFALPVTREAIAFADAEEIGKAYAKAATAMQQAGVLMGQQNNKFNPAANATRAEVAAMLTRYAKLIIDPNTAQGWAQDDAGQFLYWDGKALTGTQTIDGVKYFFHDSGALKTGWVQDGGNWRYFSGNKLLTGWGDVDANGSNKRYFFDTYGNMVSGKWIQIEGKWYYFYTDGTLARNTKMDGYEVDENGERKMK